MHVLVILSFPIGVFTQVVYKGGCNVLSTQVQSNLNISDFIGEWFILESIKNYFQYGDCLASEIILLLERVAVSFDAEKINGRPHYMTSTMVFTQETPPRIIFSYGSDIFNHFVVTTNYDDYALMYSCRNNPGEDSRSVFGWKMSREPVFSKRGERKIRVAVKNMPDLQHANWTVINHKKCA